VQAGPEGMPAGEIADALGIAPNTLTFHFDRLRMANLVSVLREGRSMIYSARYNTMNALLRYLTENCCRGPRDQRTPLESKNSPPKAPRRGRAA
jgi:ArsR family transcriptional regulator, arsenate/arsenite/antimonite-responsive transcriptional repressor